MKIMYLGIATWPSWEMAEQKMWIWRKSIDRFGYRFFYYGVGTPHFLGYRTQKVETPLEHLKKYGWGDCTHILYTDCCDCLMLAPQGEIESKYEAMGCPPMLVSGAPVLENVSDLSRYPSINPERLPFGYPHVGGYLMEAPLFVEYLQMLHDSYGPATHGDDCFAMYDAITDGAFTPKIDTNCEIFMVRGEEHIEIIEFGGRKRIYNSSTNKFPAIWHNSGGYAAPDNYKDDLMIPMAQRLGIL